MAVYTNKNAVWTDQYRHLMNGDSRGFFGTKMARKQSGDFFSLIAHLGEGVQWAYKYVDETESGKPRLLGHVM